MALPDTDMSGRRDRRRRGGRRGEHRDGAECGSYGRSLAEMREQGSMSVACWADPRAGPER
jgi:hypothetical protein